MKITKRLVALISTVAITLSLTPNAFAFSYADMSSGLGILGYTIQTVAPDVQYISLSASDSSGKQSIHAVEFNPESTSTRLCAGKSQGYVWSTQTVNTIANNMSNTDGGDVAVAGINGDFFNFGVGVPHGVFIEDGEILSTPPQYYAAFGLTYDDKPFIVRHGTILDIIFRINGSLVNVAGINVPHVKNSSSLVLYTDEYARGTKTGTETYELRCRVNSGEVRHGDTISFTVEEVHNAEGNTALGDGYIVLSSQGERMADLKKLEIGGTYEMSFRFNEFWSNVKFAVGGIELLLKDGKVYSETDKSNQPRTSIGIRADGTVVMATFDGRGAGDAVGMSYKSAASAMRALGCVDALNLDGGGSTTFVLREPGSMSTSIVNNTSGSARQVANALVLMNVSPTLPYPSHLTLSPTEKTILLGGRCSFKVASAYDDNYKPHAVPADVYWSTTSSASEISDSGIFSASEVGSFNIVADSGSATGIAKIDVVDHIDSITTDVSEITAKPGEKIKLSATARLNGKVVDTTPDIFTWNASEALGEFSAPGELTLSDSATSSEVTVSYGDISAKVKINLQVPPKELTGFEDDSVTFIPVGISTNVKPNAKLDSDINRVHNGKRSLKMYYNFLNTKGSVGSYLMVDPSSADTSAYHLSAVPGKLGMRVWGDGSAVGLRSLIEDANGAQHSISYGNISHTGWKYMEASLPDGIVGPIYIKVPVHVVSNPANLTQGCLYFDSLRAIYSEVDIDMEPPKVQKAWPSSNMVIYTKKPSIGVILEDGKNKIDPASVEIFVNGYNCTDRSFDTATNKLSYTVKHALKAGKHSIIVRARDTNGNLMQREWSFEVR